MTEQLKGYKRPEVSGKLSGKYKHGHASYVLSPTYRSWAMMRQRCLNPNNTNFADYGGRGVIICYEWDEFSKFLEDMGERPQGTNLDRIDVNGWYWKDNCRWSSEKTQQRNRRNNIFVYFKKEKVLLCELVEKYPISYNAVQGRVYRKKITHQEAVNEIVYEKGL